MYPFRRLLVGLDFTTADQPLLAYAAFMAQAVAAGEVRFVHVRPGGDKASADVHARFPALGPTPDGAALRNAMLTYVADADFPEVEVSAEVLTGNPVSALVRYVRTHDVDLLLLGRKAEARAASVVCRRLVLQARCSLLFVPTAAAVRVEKLLIPFDTRDYSQLALQRAFELADQHQLTVICQILYDVPTGYTKSGKSYEAFAEVMRAQAERKFEAFVQKQFGEHPAFIETRYTLDRDHHPADDIYQLAHKEGVDLLLVGSRGRGTGAAFLLKDVAERLFCCNDALPLLIAKRKQTSLNLFRALLEL